LFGVVIHATSEHKWMVHFDNGTQCECTSNTLTITDASSSLPGYPSSSLAAWAAAKREDNSKEMRMSGRNAR